MWFDPSEPQREYEDGIFGYNPWGFAYFLEPEGFRAVQALKGPRLDQYEKFVPMTVEIAKGVYDTIRQVNEQVGILAERLLDQRADLDDD